MKPNINNVETTQSAPAETPAGATDSRLNALEFKIDAIYVSVEKTRKYFLWTMAATIVAFVLPLIGLIFALPSFFNNYIGGIQGADQNTQLIQNLTQ